MPTISQEIASLQKLLLPSTLPDLPGYHFAVHYQPCEAAGGDFYGWQIWDNGVMGIGVADVAGHGLRAAVVMAMLRTWLAAFRYYNRPMDAISRDLNSFFAEMGNLHTFLTIVMMQLKPQTGDFAIRNAGHPSPKLRRRDGEVITIDGGRSLPLGIMFDEPDVPEAAGQLKPGDAIVLYTDGVTDSTAEDGSFFDIHRLDKAINTASGDAGAIVKSIAKSLLAHRGKRHRRDDECIVVISRDP